MTKLSIASLIGLLAFHPSAFAISNFYSNDPLSKKEPWYLIQSQQNPVSDTSGLDFSSVAASAVSGYLVENSNNNYWPNAAAAIAISAGLQYTADSQFDSISDVKISPYFSGSETGIRLSFSFQ